MRGTDPVVEASPAGAPETAALGLEARRVLVVLIPCLDEERTVGGVVSGVPRNLPGFARVEVVVLDDGSTDGTAKAAGAAGARVLRLEHSGGLGRVFEAGCREALALGADAAVTIDGDGQFDPADIPRLLLPLIEGRVQMVTASRFLDRDLTPAMPWVKRWGNRRVASVVRWLTGRRFYDVSCGFRAFSREALLRLHLFGRFTYTQETFIDLLFKGLEIEEVPVRVRGEREFGESRIASSLTRYAVRSLAIMLRAFLSYRPLAFFAALSAPFLAAGATLLTFLLAHYFRTGAFTPHIWAGFVGGSLAFTGILVIALGLLGDMLVRIRRTEEEALYLLRRSTHAVDAPRSSTARS